MTAVVATGSDDCWRVGSTTDDDDGTESMMAAVTVQSIYRRHTRYRAIDSLMPEPRQQVHNICTHHPPAVAPRHPALPIRSRLNKPHEDCTAGSAPLPSQTKESSLRPCHAIGRSLSTKRLCWLLSASKFLCACSCMATLIGCSHYGVGGCSRRRRALARSCRCFITFLSGCTTSSSASGARSTVCTHRMTHPNTRECQDIVSAVSRQ